jgi:hypothetical protein
MLDLTSENVFSALEDTFSEVENDVIDAISDAMTEIESSVDDILVTSGMTNNHTLIVAATEYIAVLQQHIPKTDSAVLNSDEAKSFDAKLLEYIGGHLDDNTDNDSGV